MVCFHKALPNVKSVYVALQVTPDLQKNYTDISAISVTFCNSGCVAGRKYFRCSHHIKPVFLADNCAFQNFPNFTELISSQNPKPTFLGNSQPDNCALEKEDKILIKFSPNFLHRSHVFFFTFSQLSSNYLQTNQTCLFGQWPIRHLCLSLTLYALGSRL